MIRSKITQPQIRKTKQPVEGVFCNYSHRTCMHNRLEGFEYCIKHILEDKNGPYKQCGFISLKNGKRCINAAPKTDKRDGYVLMVHLVGESVKVMDPSFFKLHLD